MDNFVARVGRQNHLEAGLYTNGGLRKYLNQSEQHRLISAASRLCVVKELFVLTLLWSGGRISEVLALTPLSFQIDEQVVGMRTLKRRRSVTREVPLPPDLLSRIQRVFGLRDRQCNPEQSSSRLWEMSRTTAWRIVKSTMRDAGLFGPSACPRGLRHSFGIATTQAGVPLTLVQRWLGHARVTTTAIYLDACGPEELALASRYWNANGLPSGH
ncbi:MAG: tyrosine-type recombinase/integrase [Hyphomicrobiaceae bacterium]